MLPTTPALEGERQDLYWKVAQAFFDAPDGRLAIEDFGSRAERTPISPIIGHLRRRSSTEVRIELGLSVRKRNRIYGAIFSDRVGHYRWDPNFMWPSVGEVDARVIEAQENARLREANSVKASPRKPKIRVDEVVENEDVQLTFSDPPPLGSGASLPPATDPPPPTPTDPPSVAPEATQAPQVADEPTCRLLALTDSVVVLQTADKIIVADVKSVSAI